MFFDTLDEARLWLMLNRGPEGRSWKRCATCRPGREAVGNRPQLRVSRPSATVREAKGGSGATSRGVRGPIPDSWAVHAAFAMPDSPPLQLSVPPRLASWNKADDPDQVRLADVLHGRAGPQLDESLEADH